MRIERAGQPRLPWAVIQSECSASSSCASSGQGSPVRGEGGVEYLRNIRVFCIGISRSEPVVDSKGVLSAALAQARTSRCGNSLQLLRVSAKGHSIPPDLADAEELQNKREQRRPQNTTFREQCLQTAESSLVPGQLSSEDYSGPNRPERQVISRIVLVEKELFVVPVSEATGYQP